jgi:small subunit ribosomal protein S11
MATVKATTNKAKKAKAVRQVSQGCAYIQATFNNTIVTVTDQNGNTLAWSSAGACGFRGPKKATPYAASMIVKTIADKVKETGLREVAVYVTGVGSGRDSAVRALNANGFTVTGIKDMTPLPHNGCRSPRARRV